MKSVFNGKPQPSITISAPLVLSWLYYGKSFEAMVRKINELAKNPKADKIDKLNCSVAVKQIIKYPSRQASVHKPTGTDSFP